MSVCSLEFGLEQYTVYIFLFLLFLILKISIFVMEWSVTLSKKTEKSIRSLPVNGHGCCREFEVISYQFAV